MSKILIFTDLHAGSDISGKGKEGINTHGSQYERILEALNMYTIREKIDIIVNLGDFGIGKGILFSKNKELYQKICESFGGKALLHVMGNHCLGTCDGNVSLARRMLGITGIQEYGIGGKKLVLTDVEFENREGKMPDETLEKLSEIARSEKEPWYLFTHYPVSEDEKNMSYYHRNARRNAFLKNSAQVRKVLEGSMCQRIISGHSHSFFEDIFDGIPHTTLPSISEDNNGVPLGKVGILDTENNSLELKNVL